MHRRTDTPRDGIAGLSWRTLAGIGIVMLVALFIVLNRDETEISFILFSTQSALWVALTVAAFGGFLAGFLIGRHRYRA